VALTQLAAQAVYLEVVKVLPLCFLLLFGFSTVPTSAQEGVDSASDASVPPRVQSSAEMTQREIDRRREVTFRLNENLDLAERLYQAGEWEHAQAKFRLVMNQTDPQTNTSGFYHRARVGVAKSLAAQALAQEKEGKTAEAAGLMKQAADLDPANAQVAKQAANMQEEASRGADPFEGNPAATADLVEKTKEIKKLLSLADQLTETGQYRSARQKLDDVLRIDPYNSAARKKIEVVEKKRLLVADKRYSASRVKAMTQVTEAWIPPPPARVDPKQTRGTGKAVPSNSAEILQALSTIEIPEIVFNEKPLRDAVEELQRLSEQNDPKKKGINFVLRLSPPAQGVDPEAATVSLELRNVKLQTALKYLCEQIRGGEKLRYDVENSAVLILPVTEIGGELETRSYTLPPSLLANSVKPGEAKTPKELGKLVLDSIGVNTSMESTSAMCFSDTGKLVVRNTPNELSKVEQRIRDAQGEPPQKQFEVETKFLSFTENDVKNFTFNLQMSGNTSIPAPGSPGALYNPASATGGTDGLRGTAGFNPGGGSITALQALLDPTYPQNASNQIGVNAQVFGRGFAAVLQLLQNAIGKDLVAAPRVTLADGKQSKIVISRRMYYPTTYTQPQVPNNDQGVGAGFILPANPTGFEYRDIGTTLEVKGESTSIPKAVDLDFTNLLVEDFEGFVDYGVLISTVTEGGQYSNPTTTDTSTTQNLGAAPFLVPIFTKKSLQSRVRLIDGETVGMGGLISDVVQLVDDKVPMLGDIPMLGRLFRGEASQKIKSNLVIFCTLRIINPDGTLVFPEDEENPEFAQGGSSEMMPSVP
jgi:general secretion pathway protein D